MVRKIVFNDPDIFFRRVKAHHDLTASLYAPKPVVYRKHDSLSTLYEAGDTHLYELNVHVSKSSAVEYERLAATWDVHVVAIAEYALILASQEVKP